MPAPKGNQFWKLAPKVGRDKVFESKESLEAACMEYFEITNERFIEEQQWAGKDAIEVSKKHKVPFTQSGLLLFLGVSVQTWLNYKSKPGYEEFFEVVARVEQIIYTQKFEGASVNQFNSNIIARDLGLIDRKGIDASVEIRPIEFNIVRKSDE